MDSVGGVFSKCVGAHSTGMDLVNILDHFGTAKNSERKTVLGRSYVVCKKLSCERYPGIPYK